MRIVRNSTLAAAVAGALVLGSAALAQEAKKPEAKPRTSHEERGHGMGRMHEMRGGCHGEAREEHNRS